MNLAFFGSVRIVSFFLVVAALVSPAYGQGDKAAAGSNEVETIKKLLNDQKECWNRQDIEGFMAGYWRSEEMTFSGGGKVARGWQATIDRYKKNYPKEKMGQLDFRNLEVTLLSDSAAMVLGDFHLTMPDRVSEGNFTLVLKKMSDGWKVIHDHSSSLEPKKEKP
jgi:ketosteroid isomerase-like protein